MPKGSVSFTISDLPGDAVAGKLFLEFTPFPGEPGTGGERMNLETAVPSTQLIVTGIPCRGGVGTLYKVSVSHRNFKTYSFFQMIREGANGGNEPIRLWVNPGRVRAIAAPQFSALTARAQAILDGAQMMRVTAADGDLLGLTGGALYRALGPLRMACFLNLIRKASHIATADNSLKFVHGVLVARQDRFFARVSEKLPDAVRESPVFKSAPNTLHDPLPGFVLAEGSFKTRDAHANLQITFMRETSSGTLAADIDIDESSGIEHGFEVIRNAVFQNKTNPYLIREFLFSSELREQTLDPGYRFVF